MNSLISIITPSYNSSKFISQTIESVLSQTYTNWEMLIIDDFSSDNSNKIIEQFKQKDSRIKLYKMQENRGVVKARNYAISLAHGKYIAFLDSDDIWSPDKLEKQIRFMKENDLSLTYSAYDTIDKDSKYMNTRNVPSELSYYDMLKSNYIGNLTGIYNVNFFGKVYLEEVGHEDYILWLTLMKQISHTKGITTPLASYRILSKSVSSNKFKALQWQWHIYRKIEKLNFIKSAYYFVLYIYNALNKRI